MAQALKSRRNLRAERLRNALILIGWYADAGRQFNPGTEETMRDLFRSIRDCAWDALQKDIPQ
jgi:hypothetical protein